jgi:large subunit ribosomal protein L25
VPDIVLVADTSRPTGSANARRLRHHGRIPAVVYGHGVESTPVSVDARSLRSALSTAAGRNVILDLEIDGAHHMAMAKVVDHHPVRHTISHVDFLVVDRDEKVTVDVPLTIVGEPTLVAREGGLVEQLLHAVTVSTLPGSIPSSIEVDVSELEVGSTIRLADLTLPAGVTTDIDLETPIVMGAHAAVEVPEAAASEEEGEAASAEGEGGSDSQAAAPDSGGDS